MMVTFNLYGGRNGQGLGQVNNPVGWRVVDQFPILLKIIKIKLDLYTKTVVALYR